MEKEEDDPAGGVEEQDAGIGTRPRSGKEEETRVLTPPPPPLFLLSALPQGTVRPCRRHHRCPQEGRKNPFNPYKLQHAGKEEHTIDCVVRARRVRGGPGCAEHGVHACVLGGPSGACKAVMASWANAARVCGTCIAVHSAELCRAYHAVQSDACRESECDVFCLYVG